MQKLFTLPDALAGGFHRAALRQRILKICFNAGQAVHAAHPDSVFKMVVQAAVVQIDGAHNGLLPVHDHHLGVGEAGASAPAGKPQGGKDAKPAAPSQTIYGKPFHGNVTPMRELSQDSDVGRVIVEGRVFAVNHKELKKRNAWVVNFDMTDYTGSIRVNRFMEADQAKPLIDAIQKPGKWLRVQGFISFSRFENDIVLEPLAVQAAEAPVRVDTAPEKRVELHLHTTMSMMDALTKTGEAVATAARWGHRAIAITDHGVASSFPAALNASKNSVPEIVALAANAL